MVVIKLSLLKQSYPRREKRLLCVKLYNAGIGRAGWRFRLRKGPSAASK